MDRLELPDPAHALDRLFEDALAAERKRTGRALNLARFAGLSVWLVLCLVLVLFRGYSHLNMALLFLWWAAAGVVVWLGRSSDRFARMAVTIPFIDIPLSFFFHQTHLPDSPNVGFDIGVQLCWCVLFLLAAMATLSRSAVWAAAIIGTILEIASIRYSGLEFWGAPLAVVFILGLAAMGGAYVIGQARRMMEAVVAEQARREQHTRAAAEKVRRLNVELEQRVETRTAELAAANKDLEAFAYSVSHDLRAPLRVASSYAAMLKNEFASGWDPAAQELLARIVASNSRMNVLIEELLRLAHLGRKEIVKQAVDMTQIARGVVASLRAEAPDRVIEWTIGDLPPAWGDPVLIEQVFANLVGNAVKYTGTRERARIEIGCGGDGHHTYFVRDDGVGFDMSKAHRLFQVFERLHYADEFDGNGIGLAMVERIVTKHGGTVRAESAVGQGATFRFHLPPR